jgi:hypothetical protein
MLRHADGGELVSEVGELATPAVEPEPDGGDPAVGPADEERPVVPDPGVIQTTSRRSTSGPRVDRASARVDGSERTVTGSKRRRAAMTSAYARLASRAWPCHVASRHGQET